MCFRLKRFHGTGSKQSKIQTPVRFPISNLDLSPYLLGTQAPLLHDLIASIEHTGNQLDFSLLEIFFEHCVTIFLLFVTVFILAITPATFLMNPSVLLFPFLYLPFLSIPFALIFSFSVILQAGISTTIIKSKQSPNLRRTPTLIFFFIN